MGRRATKKVTTNGTLTEHRRFLYRGYLQIACCDLTRAYTPALWFILWDPTQETATRPLAIQKNGTWYTYGWDLTKNICETYRTDGRIDLAYTYTPYGEVSPAHTYDQPLRWSSEYHDVELGLHYYNYRHYNPVMGRWMRRDPRIAYDNRNYIYISNAPNIHRDSLGLVQIRTGRIKLKDTNLIDEDIATLSFNIKETPDGLQFVGNTQSAFGIAREYNYIWSDLQIEGDYQFRTLSCTSYRILITLTIWRIEGSKSDQTSTGTWTPSLKANIITQRGVISPSIEYQSGHTTAEIKYDRFHSWIKSAMIMYSAHELENIYRFVQFKYDEISGEELNGTSFFDFRFQQNVKLLLTDEE